MTIIILSLSDPFVKFISGVIYCSLHCFLFTPSAIVFCFCFFFLGSPRKAVLHGKCVNSKQQMTMIFCCGREDLSFCRQTFIYVSAMYLQSSGARFLLDSSVAELLTQTYLSTVYFTRRGCIL